MMTEERYSKLSSSIDYYKYWDNKEEKGLTEDEVVDSLNKQDNEIKEWKSRYFNLKEKLGLLDD